MKILVMKKAAVIFPPIVANVQTQYFEIAMEDREGNAYAVRFLAHVNYTGGIVKMLQRLTPIAIPAPVEPCQYIGKEGCCAPEGYENEQCPICQSLETKLAPGIPGIVEAGQGTPVGALRGCRVCHCTDMRACPGGCSWVTEDLCSACAGQTPASPAPEGGIILVKS